MGFSKGSKSALLGKASAAIKKGKVIIFPTDTVYGFLADATDKKAVEAIYKIKKRSRSKPLPVFVRDLKMAKELAKISSTQEKILKKYWPGKYTFVFRKKKSAKIFGVDGSTIALRIPKYKPLNDLSKKVNKPLVQTSVNISGEQPMVKIKDIRMAFALDPNVGIIVDGGNLPKAKPSVIMDLTKDNIKILRK